MLNRKKVIVFVLAVVGALILGAVIFGILNALVVQGKWSFGWRDYRYDESGFEIGEGSIPADAVTHIELDWIDGEVEIVPCQDRYFSVTEFAQDELPESAKVRWRVSEDGSTLTVRYRKSSWFFGVGSGNREKKLTLRVPERFFDQLSSLDVSVVSTNVTVKGMVAESFSFSSDMGALSTEKCVFGSVSVTTKNGDIRVGADVDGTVEMSSRNSALTLITGTCPQQIKVETKGGDVTLSLPEDASFALEWTTDKGGITSDFAGRQDGTVYTVGTGEKQYSVQSRKGDLLLTVTKATEAK